MPNAGFVHLHVHSAYSLLKGSIKIAKLGELAKADRQPALALTDTDNMFGALEFSDKMAGYGIQPIVGCEVAVDFGDVDPNTRSILATTGPTVPITVAGRPKTRTTCVATRVGQQRSRSAVQLPTRLLAAVIATQVPDDSSSRTLRVGLVENRSARRPPT